jgi:RNA polymerase sigma factor (sigma-70 family)
MQPERPEDAGSLDHALSVFVSVRPRLFGIAYRMLGSAADAEDIVQNVWLRWQTTDRSVVSDAPAFLATATARLAINLAQSARSRREAYVGPWLPEPVDTSPDPQLGAERGAALEFAILLLLENLSPKERAAYVLREAFNYPYQQIADTLRLSEANVRQLVTRARKHIADKRRTPVSAAEQRRLLVAFIAAAQKGDIAALEGLLASDVVSSADGGGIVRAARVPVVGRAIVAKFIAAIASHFWTGVTLEWIEANAQASVVILRDGAVVGLVTINVGGGHRPDYVGDETEQARGDFILIAGITCAVAAGAPSTSPCRPDFSLSRSGKPVTKRPGFRS